MPIASTEKLIARKAIEIWTEEIKKDPRSRKLFRSILGLAINQYVRIEKPSIEKSTNGNFNRYFESSLRIVKRKLGYDPTKTVPLRSVEPRAAPLGITAEKSKFAQKSFDFKQLAAHDTD